MGGGEVEQMPVSIYEDISQAGVDYEQSCNGYIKVVRYFMKFELFSI